MLNQTLDLINGFVSRRTPRKSMTFSNEMPYEGYTLLEDTKRSRYSVLEMDTTVIEKGNSRSERSIVQSTETSEVNINRIVCDALSQSDVPNVGKIIQILESQFDSIKNYEKCNLKRIFCAAELRTWKLLKTLNDESLRQDCTTSDSNRLMNHAYSEKAIVAEMLKADQLVRKISLIVDWLESTYEVSSTVPPTKFCYFENTINNKAGGLNSSVSVHLDCQFDNQKFFHNSDSENVAVFMRFAFELIRRGKIDELTQFAVEYGFAWLPAALEGRKLSHDPNFSGNMPNGKQAKTGNAQRKLWKRVCAANVANKSIQLYERAIYAVFAGDLDVLLSVAKTPNDKLWSYCKCFLESMQDYQIGLYKNEEHTSPKPSLDLVKIFDSINTSFSSNDDVGSKVEHFFNEVQQVIIQGKFGHLDHLLGAKKWLSNDGEIALRMDRFCALFAIVTSSLNSVHKYDDVIRRFCEALQRLGQMDLVPDFLKFAENSVGICLQFVVGLKSTDRDVFLECCQMKGIEVSSVKQELFVHYKLSYSTSDAVADAYSATPDEEIMIKSLLNLQTEVANETEFLCHANSLMRLFLGNKRIFPCFKVLDAVPIDIINCIVQQQRNFSCMEDTLKSAVDLPPKESCIIKEFLCLKKAVQLLIELQTVGRELTDCDISEEEQVDVCYSGVLEILNYAGGWLVDDFDDALVSEGFFTEERTRQMTLLRQLIIPEIVISAVSCLKQKNRAMFCSDILASLMDSKLADDLNANGSFNAINEFCLDALVMENSDTDELCDLF